MTDYISNTEQARGRNTRGVYTSRRHSGSPYVKVILNGRENDILLQHVSKNQTPAPPDDANSVNHGF